MPGRVWGPSWRTGGQFQLAARPRSLRTCSLTMALRKSLGLRSEWPMASASSSASRGRVEGREVGVDDRILGIQAVGLGPRRRPPGLLDPSGLVGRQALGLELVAAFEALGGGEIVPDRLGQVARGVPAGPFVALRHHPVEDLDLLGEPPGREVAGQLPRGGQRDAPFDQPQHGGKLGVGLGGLRQAGRRPTEDDLPLGALPDVTLIVPHRLEVAGLDQLPDGGPELLLDLAHVPGIGRAQADVGKGEIPEREGHLRFAIEPLVEEAVHPLARGVFQGQVEPIVEILEIPRREAVEDGLVPVDLRGQEFPLPSPRSAVADLALVEDVEHDRGPALLRFDPPGVVILEAGDGPTLERGGESVVALAVVRPPEEVDQLAPGEADLAIGEAILQLRQLDQGDDDVFVDPPGQPMSHRRGDRQLAGDDPVGVRIERRVLVDERGPTVVGAIGEQRKGELRQVHLVLGLDAGGFGGLGWFVLPHTGPTSDSRVAASWCPEIIPHGFVEIIQIPDVPHRDRRSNNTPLLLFSV